MATIGYKKKLIEVAMPLQQINKQAVREKSIRRGHPSTFHLWWARRPLATCRAVLFAQLVDDPSAHPDKFPSEADQATERERLFRIIEELVIWENSTNQEVLKRARNEILKSCDGKMPPVYDPFSGGGSIPLEAQRLGLPAYGSDLNPVAVMIGKAMIEVPQPFKNKEPQHPGNPELLNYKNYQGLKEDILWYGKALADKCWRGLQRHYPTISHQGREKTVMCWLWARTVASPDPALGGIHVPLLSTYWLCKKPNKKVWAKPVLSGLNYSFDICQGTPNPDFDPSVGTKMGRGANFKCLISGSAISAEYVKAEGMGGRMKWRLFAVVAEGARGREYFQATEEQQKVALDCQPKWQPELPLSQHPQYMSVTNYGPTTFADLFMPRQNLALETFIQQIDAVTSNIPDENYRNAIQTYLSIAVSRLANRQSANTFWDVGGENIQQVFAMQALPMRWDTAEGNPFSNSSGNFLGQLDYLCKNFDNFPEALNPAKIRHTDARDANFSDMVVSTDPPYYDNVPYADLSDFFYVWLKRGLSKIYPAMFGGLLVPKQEELVADHVRHNSKQNADQMFVDGMTQVMGNIASQADIKYPSAIYYAFKQSETSEDGESSPGWVTFLEAVINSGFSIKATWPVRTELVGNLKKVKNVLANSVVLVCRKREAALGTITRAEFIRQLKTELPKAIADLKAANISPADIPQSSIGPGIGIFSRYQAVLENDDSPMTIKTALQLINRELGEEEGEYDAETSFALTWFEQNGFNVGDFGTAANIANAKGIAVENLTHAGIAQSSGGKFGLLARESLEERWDPVADNRVTIWECCQYLIRRMENRGEFEAAKLMKAMGSERAEAAKELAYALYDIAANRLNDATEATAYNGLIAVWSELSLQAANITDAEMRGGGQGQLL